LKSFGAYFLFLCESFFSATGVFNCEGLHVDKGGIGDAIVDELHRIHGKQLNSIERQKVIKARF
jgi:hypothetical protein